MVGGLDQLAALDGDVVLYVAAPLRPSQSDINVARETLAYSGKLEEIALKINLARAERWLAWLSVRFPAVTFIAPWIAAIMSGADDADPDQRDRGLRDDCRVVRRCNGIVLCGGRVSSGMHTEREVAHHEGALIVDLTALGSEPPP